MPKEIVLHKTKINLTELVKASIEKTGLGNDGIEVFENYTDLPLIHLDQEKIQGVINNLILNAQESIQDEGRVFVSTFEKDKNIILEVKDNGPGMTKQFLDYKLFKPFQTTKKKGLGIGLYQCKIIMAAHGGKIEAESEEGKGAQFRLYFPFE